MFDIESVKQRDSWLWKLIGFLSMGVFWNYSYFFEREDYFRRKYLLKWLEQNGLQSTAVRGEISTSWEINGYNLHLWDKDNSVSLHKNFALIICSFNSSGIDAYRYKKIQKILIDERQKLN